MFLRKTNRFVEKKIYNFCPRFPLFDSFCLLYMFFVWSEKGLTVKTSNEKMKRKKWKRMNWKQTASRIPIAKGKQNCIFLGVFGVFQTIQFAGKV
jgi:hypothetical protein